MLNSQATSAPPTNTLPIVFHEAMRVKSRINAPMAMAMTLVSPMEPGIKPSTMSEKVEVGAMPAAASPRGVAMVVPSGRALPKPHTLSEASHTVSPLMLVG